MKSEFNNILENGEVKKNNAGFSLPDQYFQEFEESLMDHIQTNINRKALKKHQSTKRIMNFISWSAAAIITIGAFFFVQDRFVNFEETEVSEEIWDYYTSADESWIIEELDDISIQDDAVIDSESIDFLMNEGVTNDEILLAINDNDDFSN